MPEQQKLKFTIRQDGHVIEEATGFTSLYEREPNFFSIVLVMFSHWLPSTPETSSVT